MSQPKVSVIVPVYNVDKFLEKCLDSIVSQTLKDIEIVCVNDGSTDKSRKILAKYAKEDSRIVIVDKKNGGLSSARNAGMKVAKGEYIGFVDSDDWIDETMYEKMYSNAKQFNSQMVITAVHKYDDQLEQIVDDDPYFTMGYFDKTFDNRTFNHFDTKDFLFEVSVMAWNKLYERNFIEKCSAQFPDGLIFEDGPFFHSIFYKMDRVTMIRDFLYYYRINRKNSIIAKGDKNFIDIFDVVELIWNNIINLPYFGDIKYDFLEKRFNDVNYRFTVMNKKYRKKYFKRFKNFDIFYNSEHFDENVIKEKYYYIYEHLKNIREHSYWDFETNYVLINIKNRIMHKIMEILYYNHDYYWFMYKQKMFFSIKKNPKVLDIWYEENFIYVHTANMKKKIPFNYERIRKKIED